MHKYTINRENYFVFNTKTHPRYLEVQFMWGKLDFRMTFKKVYLDSTENSEFQIYRTADTQYFIVESLEYKVYYEWYRYVKVVKHGIVNESVLWSKDSNTHIIELPKDLLINATDLCCKVLKLSLAQDIC